MIVYPNSLVLSAETPLTHARIGYQTFTDGLVADDIVVSTETADGPRDAPLRPDTFEYWEPSALPATWQLDLGSLKDIDYIGIVGKVAGMTIGAKIEESVTDFLARLEVNGGATPSSNLLRTPDSAAASITGNIEIIARVTMNDWTPGVGVMMAFVDKNSSDTSGYRFGMNSTDRLRLDVYVAGALRTALCTAATGFTDGTTHWLRVTRDSATGNVNFYTSTPEDGVTWTLLGAANVATTAGAIVDGADPLHVGGAASAISNLNGSVKYAAIYNAIGGPTPVVKCDLSEAVTDATSFVSSTGETWTLLTSGGTPARIVNPRFGGSVIVPSDNAAIMFMDELRSARHIQISLSGSGSPNLAVVYVGKMLAMQRMIYGGHSPITLSRQTLLKQPMSRGGEFLGQSFRKLGIQSSASFKNLTAGWYRSEFDPFVKAARKQPFFFAWRPLSFPNEVGFVWSGEDISPSNMGRRDFMEVSWKMTGKGYE